MTDTAEIRAEIRLPTQELRNDLPFYTKTLGFRLDMIFPADNPSVAVAVLIEEGVHGTDESGLASVRAQKVLTSALQTQGLL